MRECRYFRETGRPESRSRRGGAPLLARGVRSTARSGAGSQVGPCLVTRCGTLSTDGCPARETSRGGCERWESDDAPASRRHNLAFVYPQSPFSIDRIDYLNGPKSRDDNTTLPKYRYFCCLFPFNYQSPLPVDTSKVLMIYLTIGINSKIQD